MDGARDQLQQVYVKDREDVELGALVVDPSGEFLYFVEKMKQVFIRLSLQGIITIIIIQVFKEGGLFSAENTVINIIFALVKIQNYNY